MFFYAIHNLPHGKDLGTLERSGKTVLYGAICYVILYALINSNYIPALSKIKFLKKYFIFVFIADFAVFIILCKVYKDLFALKFGFNKSTTSDQITTDQSTTNPQNSNEFNSSCNRILNNTPACVTRTEAPDCPIPNVSNEESNNQTEEHASYNTHQSNEQTEQCTQEEQLDSDQYIDPTLTQTENIPEYNSEASINNKPIKRVSSDSDQIQEYQSEKQ